MEAAVVARDFALLATLRWGNQVPDEVLNLFVALVAIQTVQELQGKNYVLAGTFNEKKIFKRSLENQF